MIDLKRVIDLTWIKKMMNRLFEAEKNEEFEETFDDIDLEENKEHDLAEKPAFRFPIITDAEIYGWEPDPENERRKADNLITELDDDDFNPVPLYKNERWPGGNDKPTIHRATAPLKYNIQQELITKPAQKRRTEKVDEVETSRNTIIQKRSNRPFTPTEVPSPVYGYSRPKSDRFKAFRRDEEEKANEELPIPSRNEFEVDQNEIEPMIEQSMVDEEIHRIDLEDHAHTSDKEMPVEPKIDDIVEWSSAKPDENEIDTEMNDEQLPIMEERQFDDVDEGNFEEYIEAEPYAIPSDEEEESTTAEPIIEEVKEPAHTPEQKRERIVPFNVLMLKNDKLKYEDREKKS